MSDWCSGLLLSPPACRRDAEPLREDVRQCRGRAVADARGDLPHAQALRKLHPDGVDVEGLIEKIRKEAGSP